MSSLLPTVNKRVVDKGAEAVGTICLRRMEPKDRSEVAELICVSINYWYRAHGMAAVFRAGPASTEIFFGVYEALDPGCGIVAQNARTGRLMGSCFFHPRPEHVSLGIMNVHPNYFGQGVARALLEQIIEYAETHGNRPLRVTQSAMNLDSFSLYNRAGFVPRYAYQDMIIGVPDRGLAADVPGRQHVRPATAQDVPAMTALEMQVAGINRQKDFQYCLQNRQRIWQTLVYEGPTGGVDGLIISVKHPALCMLGPCVARTQQQAAALVAKALDRFRGGGVLLLPPVDCSELVGQMYRWGARNCELHFGQVRGRFQPFQGVSMPTFLPETG